MPERATQSTPTVWQLPLTHVWPPPHGGFTPHAQAPEAEQVSALLPHAVHTAPAVPHVATLFVSQTPEVEQHPVGHEVASQTQVPLEQR